MSHAQLNQTHDHEDRHPALTPLVIDLIPDQTQAELEASIDESLAVEREVAWDTREEAGPFIDPKADDEEELDT